MLTVIASALIALALAPSASARTTPLQLTVLYLDFTSYSCRVDEPLVCDVTITGPVKSNLSTTEGIVEYTIVLTWEGFEFSPCNTVDETAVFTFDTGTITTHSVHRDCPATILPGPRIQGSFTVIGGTGAFEGATGSGRVVGGGPPVVYNGTIDF
jgi:hypothetical protein